MDNGGADFANNVKHLTLTTFFSYFTGLNNHENPFRLLLLVLFNNNEIQEQNQIKNIKFLLYTRLKPFLVLPVCRPFPRQSATGTQFNVAIVTGHWPLVLDLIDMGIQPGLPHKIRH